MQHSFTLRILFAAVLSIAAAVTVAHAQQTATTADGKKVALNADGTWKYVDHGVTLKIEAALIYANGDVKPVARKSFILLGAGAMAELTQLPDAIRRLRGTCEKNHPDVETVIRKHVRYTFENGFDGKGELKNIEPGKYWLFGQMLTRDYCITWFTEVDLMKDQSIRLDQNNAI